MTDPIEFPRNIIKGKIAEVVFEFMFRQSGQYTVIPFGYEYSHPEIAQNLQLLEDKGVIDTLRSSPDFLLISLDKKDVHFVEVKYMKDFNTQWIYEDAQQVIIRWPDSYLFVATPEGFYYEPCSSVIQKKGSIGKLFETGISKESQIKFLELLKEFE